MDSLYEFVFADWTACAATAVRTAVSHCNSGHAPDQRAIATSCRSSLIQRIQLITSSRLPRGRVWPALGRSRKILTKMYGALDMAL